MRAEGRSEIYELFKNHGWPLGSHLRQHGLSAVSYGLGAHLGSNACTIIFGGRCVLEALEPARSLCAV